MPVQLKLSDWPAQDRRMWASLTSRGSPLDEGGAFSHLRVTSIETFAKSYGSWLAWVEARDPDAFGLDPVKRATAARMRRWLQDSEHLSPTTRLIRAGHLLRIVTAVAPEDDWRAEARVVGLVRREAKQALRVRKAGRVLSSFELFEAGMALAAYGGTEGGPPTSLTQARQQRDGLMIAFLAMLPLRRRAFCSLDLGGAIVLEGDGIVVTLNGECTKSGLPWQAPVPPPLLGPLRHYLDHVRPWLMTRGNTNHDALWVNDMGRPYYEPHLAGRIPRITERLLGVSVSIHLFRDAAATTLAHHSPDAARLARALLGHRGFGMATRHYNHARTIDASRRYSRLIQELRKAP